MCHLFSVAWAAHYVKEVELGHNHFLVSGMGGVKYLHGTGIRIYIGSMHFGYSLAFCLLTMVLVISESKPIVYLNAVHCKFSLCLE